MTRNRKRIVAAIVVGTFVCAVAAPTGAAPRRKPKRFSAQGTIHGVGLVTHYDFLLNCPGIPTTQGVDAYVVEVPAEFQAKPSEVEAEATSSVSAHPVLEMSFYSSGCDQGDLYVTGAATLPAGTGFIVVQDIQGGAVEFELTIKQ